MGQSLGYTLCKQGQDDIRPVRNGLTVWGDYINSDTRMILAVLEISNEKYVFKSLFTLTNQHLNDADFLAVNPTLDIPVMTENNFSIISGPMQYVNYLL